MLRRALVLLTAGGFAGCSDGAAPPPVASVDPTRESLSQDDYAAQHGLELKKFDLNRDERPDIFKYYRKIPDPQNKGNQIEVLVRKEIDINNDGKVDVIRDYDDQGQEVREERTDLDFDGRIDEISYYAKGALSKKEIDLNYDAKIDVTKYYEGGRLSRVESDRDSDGRIDTWEYYESGELDRIGTDLDGDGKVDHWDKKREPAPAETPPAAEAPPATAPTTPTPPSDG